VEGWQRAGFELAKMPQMTVEELRRHIDKRDVQVLDVRRQGEYEGGHIEGADFYPLDRFKAALPSLDDSSPVAVHCASGYRSMIAASLLQRAGHNVVNVIGGYDAWKNEYPMKASVAPVSV
jgi:hydroxyacylglutathione hydrolase